MRIQVKGFQSGHHDFPTKYQQLKREWFLTASQVKSAVLSRGLGFTNCWQLGLLMTKACHPSQLPPSTGTATEGSPPSGAVPLLLNTHVTFASLSLSCPSNFNSENKEEKIFFFFFLT
ncbi:unnamed protein product [Rangifer tarandus platyrhynchus]|uniref:Uncharacterized protein n=1 Tax=Rangifer tarandus platyrhynchus TaxID=3082113 RepID=A0AC59ZIM3_RANTA